MFVDEIFRKARDARIYPRFVRRLKTALRTALDDAPLPKIQPSDLSGWLDAAHASALNDLGGRRILVFAYLPMWIDYMTAVAATLVARGADVTFAWLPYTAIERRTPYEDREVALRYGGVFAAPRPRFRAVNLTALPVGRTRLTPVLEQVAYSDTQYVLRREEIDVTRDEWETFQFRARRLGHTYDALRLLTREGAYDCALVPNGGVLEFAAAWHAANDAGLETVTMESWERLNTIAVGYGRPCFQSIAQEIWTADAKRVDPERRARVERTMNDRERPQWVGHYSFQNTAALDGTKLRAKLDLDDRRPIALVCPNVPYDAAFLRFDSGFASMADWLRALAGELLPRADWQVVVRAHPAETVMASRQSAESILSSVAPKLPEHFRFIPPGAPFNTYALMRVATAGFVFGSTTGLEMAARGLPVVMPAATHYTRKGFTRDAFTREGYLAAVRETLDGPKERLDQERIDLAWCYMDVYMNQWCRPFPWCLPTFHKDIRTWPLERVLGEDGRERFEDTFTVLAGGTRARELVARPVLTDALA